MKRLYRIKSRGKIGGVCAGLGEYLDLDPTIIRLIMLLLLFSGPGLIIYLVMLIILPNKEPETVEATHEQPSGETIVEASPEHQPAPRPVSAFTGEAGLWIGFGLMIFGGLLLLRNFGINWFHWVRFRTLWPLVLIGVGVYILIRNDHPNKS